MNSSKVRLRGSLIFVILLLLSVLGVGIFWSFQRGGRDFAVFFEAGRLVSIGEGASIYQKGPDRFLYSPGFAWFFSLFSRLPFPTALSVWTVLKVAGLILLAKKLAEPWMGRGKELGWLGTLIGILVLSKPLLIDFEYGQVNLLILASIVWALSNRKELGSAWSGALLSWTVFSFLAFAKVFPLPLLLTPFLVSKGVSRSRLWAERVGIGVGFLLSFGIPVLSSGFSGTLLLIQNWGDALLSKGMPLESHNQSFSALLFHYLSGIPTFARSEGPEPLALGASFLNSHQIALLSAAWGCMVFGWGLSWLRSGSWRDPAQWIALSAAFLILPSHLVWKTYFVMSIPVGVFLVHHCLRTRDKMSVFLLAIVFLGINFSGFDWLGHPWGAYLEAASLFLILHILMMLRVGSISR
ncbi:MAG: DUF2029 domain-containing protein [Bdellovibrio sp.]|nr:DUF2029 domain-containing protein [Bdellovibrio sp.]